MFGAVAPDADERALMRAAVRLLSGGRAVRPEEIAAAAGVAPQRIASSIIGPDLEYDAEGRVAGWALSLVETPHRFGYGGRELFTWCGPDTLVFAHLLGGPVSIASPCPVTGRTVRVEIGADGALIDLQPATALVGYVPAERIRRGSVRSGCCRPQRFLADDAAGAAWRRECPGMTTLPVRRAHAASEGVIGAPASAAVGAPVG